MNFTDIGYTISVWAAPILVAITFHEAAHGWVAWRLGDDTAYQQGRVTFNPFKHVDPFGTILVPALLLLASGGRIMFGAAKPVPINFGRLGNPRRDMVFVAAAGPVTNLGLAILSAGALHLVPLLGEDIREWVSLNLINFIWFNLLLFLFNMLPLPPLDGGRIAVAILPLPLSNRLASLERIGIMIILFALFVPPLVGGGIGIDLNLFGWLIAEPAQALMGLILTTLGVPFS